MFAESGVDPAPNCHLPLSRQSREQAADRVTGLHDKGEQRMQALLPASCARSLPTLLLLPSAPCHLRSRPQGHPDPVPCLQGLRDVES